MAKNRLDALPEVFLSTTAQSSAVSRAAANGLLRRIGPKLYTKNLIDPPEQIVRRHLWPLIAAYVPGALVADRTALENVPASDGSIFVVSDRVRNIKLPGVTIRTRKGPGPQPEDRPFIGGLFISSTARAFLDNLAVSRQGKSGVRRTLGREQIEQRLDDLVRRNGAEALNRLRDEARHVAPHIGREVEFEAFDRLVGALLGTREDALASARARARHAGTPYDPDRLRLFETLHRELRAAAPAASPARERDAQARSTQAFFEAYFSNFIEGTEFEVEQAIDIVFHQAIPRDRPADAHDVLGTWRLVSDPVEMARTPASADELLDLLRRRHATLMAARVDKGPGVFKQEANRAGQTVFVDPGQVEGTLRQGFDFYRSLETPFARAVYMMFLVSEVHPFADGNGRIARIMTNAELVASGEERILVPTVYRANYLSALKALSQTENPEPLVRTLAFAQRWVAATPWADLESTRAVLERGHAFMDANDAENAGIRLRLD
ncbi:MAG: Fic family protein [Pseudomonadota bacterium]|nr:Fic family protein [Pseudomonadota bacterium]